MAVMLRSATAPTIPHMLFLLADCRANQGDAAGLNLIARIDGQAIIRNKGMDAAPWQLQIGNFPADLVRLDHHDHFTGHIGHHPAQAKQFVEGRGASNQVDAIGTDKQLVEVVGA
ncbi:hypothetical protein D3C86_1958040 [compost metagenome]